MTPLTVVALIVLVYTTNVDSSTVINSCCDVAIKSCSYFSTTTRHPGVYKIKDCCTEGSFIQGYCDTITDGGGWLVIQRRQKNLNEDFHRFWSDYETGFGNLHSEFWYGLKSMHCLTSKGTWELRIDLTYDNDTKSYLHYNHFKVGPAADNYRLNISGFTGITPEDPFATVHSLDGQQFSTRDRDNDQWYGHCAVNAHGSTAPGGWWYSICFRINLNFNHGGPDGFILLGRKWLSPKFIEMKIRPTSNCG